MNAYPLVLKTELKSRIWGGHGLAQFGKQIADQQPVGESWEVFDLPGDSVITSAPEGNASMILNGSLAGRTIHEAIAVLGDQLMGATETTDEDCFPLLIKLLDAHETLSVQTHPSRDFAARHPGARSKDEFWLVLESEPGAVVYGGFRSHCARELIRDHACRGLIADQLVQHEAAANRAYFLPSGLCHALGGGVVVLEVQSPSDTTFRLFDWGRTGREIHLDEAVAALDPDAVIQEIHPVETMEARLYRSRICQVEVAELPVKTERMLPTDGQSPLVVMVIRGRISISGRSMTQALALPLGSTALIPAACRDINIAASADTRLLIIRPAPAA